MLRLNKHCNTAWLQDAVKRLGNLVGQDFLALQPLGIDIYQPGEF